MAFVNAAGSQIDQLGHEPVFANIDYMSFPLLQGMKSSP